MNGWLSRGAARRGSGHLSGICMCSSSAPRRAGPGPVGRLHPHRFVSQVTSVHYSGLLVRSCPNEHQERLSFTVFKKLPSVKCLCVGVGARRQVDFPYGYGISLQTGQGDRWGRRSIVSRLFPSFVLMFHVYSCDCGNRRGVMLRLAVCIAMASPESNPTLTSEFSLTKI